MIEYRTGNIIKADAEALVNTVNCVGVMGKGIALQFKQAYLENFHEYQRACRAHELRIGTVLTVPTGQLLPKYIINFPTKDHWKGKSEMSYIREGLTALVEEVCKKGITSIAVPPLGCGNGGLQWSEVGPLIEEVFAHLPDVQVLIFAPHGAPDSDTMPIAQRAPTFTISRALMTRLLGNYLLPGYRLSQLEIQKLAYFLQVVGQPLKLRYEKDKYGPYANNLNHLLQAMEGHQIRGYGDRSKEAEVEVLENALIQADALLSENPDARKDLERVAALIDGFETPYGMEMLATVHWVVREHPDIANDPDAVVKAFQSWNERKARVFSPHHIRKAWEQLSEQGWLSH